MEKRSVGVFYKKTNSVDFAAKGYASFRFRFFNDASKKNIA
jgi:hypothetical protein